MSLYHIIQVRNLCSCIKIAEDFVSPEVCLLATYNVAFSDALLLFRIACV